MAQMTWRSGHNARCLRKLKLGNDPPTRAAYQNLYDIIASRGAVDPYLYNRNMAATARDVQSARDAVAGEAASRGLSGAGTTTAVDASLASRGAQLLADQRGKYAADQADRFRQDLGLYNAMVMQPSQFLKNVALERYKAQKQVEAAKAGGRGGPGTDWGSIIGSIGSIVGAFAS